MSESKTFALSVVVAIAGALIVIVVTSGRVNVPQRQIPAAAEVDVACGDLPADADLLRRACG